MAEQGIMEKELIIPPGDYAYVLDETKGQVKVFTGPVQTTLSGTAVPVVFEGKKGFRKCELYESIRKCPVAVEGYYLVLFNPAKSEQRAHPDVGGGFVIDNKDLDIGRRINLPGPEMFSLWPGQTAQVIRGHQLRSNQYLKIRVYNEEEARKNWTSAVVKAASTGDEADDGEPHETPQVIAEVPEDLSVGTTLHIKGNEVAFYMPVTGVSVVKAIEEAPEGVDPYIREALTLERLEYCILINENGNKRYERGPQVVFPEPTEEFLEVGGSRKFRAAELNPIQGLHIKVIADYEENGEVIEAGQELFITGHDQAIYFPRPEHSLIKYDGQAKHFATAIPKGEARYVMDRMEGTIETVPGPKMLLPNPINQVFIRRVLTDKQVKLWYPGNQEALEYNANLRRIAKNAPTTRSGLVSDGDFNRATTRSVTAKRAKARRQMLSDERITRMGDTVIGGHDGVATADVNLTASMGHTSMTGGMSGPMASNYHVSNALVDATPGGEFTMESASLGDLGIEADEWSRKATYTEPRSITLDNKFRGVPTIQPWTGYAVMVVSKTGDRKVVQGPDNILLNYDEDLETLNLSTGKPKNTDELLQTVYLKVTDNKVADIIKLETADHVKLETKLVYKVDFTDIQKAFEVENYVKLLCDHARSVLKASVRRLKISDFYKEAPDIIRDIILGEKTEEGRPGMAFKENSMVVSDVDVLNVEITDEKVNSLLTQAQLLIVQGNIDLANREHGHELLKQFEKLNQENEKVKATTETAKRELEAQKVEEEKALEIAKALAAQEEAIEELKAKEAEIAVEDREHAAKLARNKAQNDQSLAVAQIQMEQRIKEAEGMAAADASRFAAVSETFGRALGALSDNETMVKVAESMSVQRMLGGGSLADVMQRMFSGTPMQGISDKLLGNGAEEPTNGPRGGRPRPPRR